MNCSISFPGMQMRLINFLCPPSCSFWQIWVTLAFFQSFGISHVLHDLSKIMETGSALTFANFSILRLHVGLWVLNFLKWCLNQSSSTTGKLSFFQTFFLASGDWDSYGQALALKREAKWSLSCLHYILCHKSTHLIQQSTLIFPSLPFASDVLEEVSLVIFDIPCQIQLQMNLSMQPCMLWYNSNIPTKWPVTFSRICKLSSSSVWVLPEDTCSFRKSSHPLCFVSYLEGNTHLAPWPWRRWCFKHDHLSWVPFPPRAFSFDTLPSGSVKRPRSALLKSRVLAWCSSFLML